MKTAIILLTLVISASSFAGDQTCKVKIYRSEYIKQNYSRTVTKILKSRRFVEDSVNPEFEISFGVSCWGGCGRPILDPDTLSFEVTRISDNTMIQSEHTSRLYPDSVFWSPSRKGTLKKLLSCDELRKI